jgi:ElaB/YqjD/DUF883 family membrane-anchored ribosome-binding protein
LRYINCKKEDHKRGKPMSRAEIARERLLANLKALLGDVEELVKATAEQTDDGVSSLRGRVFRTLESAKSTLSQGKKALNTSRQSAEAAISYAQDNPWAIAGIAAGAAMALACFIWNRCAR